MVYRFIDQYKRLFGLRWLLSRLKLSANAYYNYRKDRKLSYKQKKNMILEKITVKDVIILDTAGISSMYAADGGVIVVV